MVYNFVTVCMFISMSERFYALIIALILMITIDSCVTKNVMCYPFGTWHAIHFLHIKIQKSQLNYNEMNENRTV